MKNKIRKKGLALLLVLVTVFCLCGEHGAQQVKAAESVSFTADASQKELHRGDTVTYTVDMFGNQTGTGLDLVFIYDSAVLELQSTQEGTVFDGFSDLNDATAGTIHVVIASNNILSDGNVFTATFKVKDTAHGVVNAKIDSVQLINDNYEEITSNVLNNILDVTVTIPAASVSLNKSTISLLKGNTEALIATVLPDDADAVVTWSSSDTSVATVDANGVVTAVNKGTAAITAEADGQSAVCQITVTVPLDSIEITGTTSTLIKGQTTQLGIIYNPADTTDSKTVTWSSSDTNIATVSENGTVTALKAGTVVITANVGNKTDTYDITVEEINLTAIDIKDSTTIHKGETEQLIVTFTPDNATDDKTVEWSSSDETVVTVDTNGKVIAKSVGGAIITAKAGNHTAQCVVTVDAPLKEIVSNVSALNMIKNQTAAITYTLNPTDTTDEKTVIFSSSDTSIVTVEADGTLSAKKAGTAKITLTGANNVTAVVEVTVKEIPINEVVLNKQSAVVEAGNTITLQATIKPANNTDDDQSITWSSSDEKVVKVIVDANDSNKVTLEAVAGGTAVITAKTANGTEATCTVKVPKHMIGISLPENTELLIGDTKVLEVTVNPKDTDDDTTVVWSSSDSEIASVDEVTGMITARKAGTVEITATTNVLDTVTNKPFTATTTITVKEIPLVSIEFDKTIIEMEIGTTDILKVLYDPDNTTDDKTVVWTSSDDEVLAVKDGVLTAKKAGTATITAQVGELKVSCEITVKESEKEPDTDDNDTDTDNDVNTDTETDTNKDNNANTDTSDVNKENVVSPNTGEYNSGVVFVVTVLCVVVLIVLKKLFVKVRR